jgi:tetratricopeptide (TPR) repeat protein
MRPPAEPDQWVRDEDTRARVTPEDPTSTRPRAELPGDVAAGIRNAAFGLTTRARERLVTNTAEAVEAYNRGRYEEAARLLAPVVEVAPNVASVREVAGLASYRARRWRAASVHLTAHYDQTGDVTHLPSVMDSERALGHQRAVAKLFEDVRASSPATEVLTEARIVMAASLADRGKLDEAIELLIASGALRRVRNPSARHIRQWYALGDLYERSGDAPRARELFSRVAIADPGAFDVEERLDELGARPRSTRSRSR